MTVSEISTWLGIAVAVTIVFFFAANPGTHTEKKPFVLPDIGSPISSAMVIFDSRDVQLDTKKIAAILNNSSKEISAKAEDVPLPHGGVFPLVRVTAPVALVVTIDDSTDALEEIRELTDEAEKQNYLSKELIAKLRKCNARLGVSSANSQTTVTDKAVTVEAKTDLDPANPVVKKLLHTLQDSTHGLTFDCVNGGWMSH